MAIPSTVLRDPPEAALIPAVSELNDLRVALPPGSKYRIAVVRGRVSLDLFGVPEPRRGIGTKFMATFLSVADRHALPVHLNVASTTAFGNPTLFEVGRWYGRFGFETVRFTGEEWRIYRSPHEVRDGAASILADYEANRVRDLTKDTFDGWVFDAFNPIDVPAGPR